MLITQGERDLMLIHKMIPENGRLFVWAYTQEGKLLSSDYPQDKLLGRAFSLLGGLEQALRRGRDEKENKLFLIGSPIGMQWAVTFEKERNDQLMLVIGPVFYFPPSEKQIREGMRSYTKSREQAIWAGELCKHIDELPVMSYAVFTRYVLLIHNTLNRDSLGLDALTAAGSGQDIAPSPHQSHDRDQIYRAERAMLQMVRNGDINYQSVLRGSSDLSPGVPVQGADPLRQMKISITVFTTLVCRAAMEGGLDPEIAYPLGDSYIQAAEECRDSGELNALAGAMYHDFIYRVHHLRSNPDYSHAVQKCCDYIELSLDKKLRMADLAALCGYTENYLAEKFKKETGQSVNCYIKFARIERAKVLLSSSGKSIREIAEGLAFNTQNYFIQCFREVAGYTPAQYRKKFQKRK